ncbi:MAG: hypothetical protein B6U75_00045 [Desulfurococcales archaeon ex4484_217_1]|nr:MAG: hypothetical protein B6U75_00045 [Desulfurococcales archaeon ex4484_217_1]
MGKKNAKCEICEELEAVHICKICGRCVCSEHFNAKRRICVVCEESLCEICRKYLAIGSCTKCGRIVCEKCSRQLDPVRLVCILCYGK